MTRGFARGSRGLLGSYRSRAALASDGKFVVAHLGTTPEASRKVAGGPSEASDHRNRIVPRHRPWRGRGSNTRWRESSPRPLPRSEKSGVRGPVVSRFARDHRLPYVTPSASNGGEFPADEKHALANAIVLQPVTSLTTPIPVIARAPFATIAWWPRAAGLSAPDAGRLPPPLRPRPGSRRAWRNRGRNRRRAW